MLFHGDVQALDVAGSRFSRDIYGAASNFGVRRPPFLRSDPCECWIPIPPLPDRNNRGGGGVPTPRYSTDRVSFLDRRRLW